MLEARELAATRGDATLFSGLAFSLAPGALLRVTGANGAGKTSLLRALCGLLMPSAGEVRWKGENIRALREEYWKHLVYIGHADALKDDLTVEENLAFACALAGLQIPESRIRAALERLGMAGRERLPARALSQGQRRRTALARLAVAESLPLWILDEPFAALDAAAVERVQSIVTGHLAHGGMVVLTTHQEARIQATSVTDVRLGGQ
jgi:heme exporter protein A